MRRTLIFVLLIVASTVGAVVANTAAAATEPIVSPTADPYYHFNFSGAKGFGQVKPREIFYGGDPTGLVCHIQWHTWGGPVARGTGVGWYVGNNQSVNEGHEAVAAVVASKLGKWMSRRAYDRLTWSFPDHGGERPASSCA